MAKNNITTTKNYRLFKISEENRPLSLKGRRALRESMQTYGFLRSFPISCCRNGDKHLVVKDGQNRLAIAEELSLPVYYVVDDVDFDIAEVNNAQKSWAFKDYAGRFAAQGNKHYIEGLDFAESHGMPGAKAFALLAGHTNFSNISHKFKSGEFEIVDKEFADTVASAYVAITRLSSNLKQANFLGALMAACLVDGFDTARLINGCSRCADRLVSYSTRDAYLQMIEDVYNYGKAKLVPVRMPAMQIMRTRNPCNK